jgi:hypothetical protein
MICSRTAKLPGTIDNASLFAPDSASLAVSIRAALIRIGRREIRMNLDRFGGIANCETKLRVQQIHVLLRNVGSEGVTPDSVTDGNLASRSRDQRCVRIRSACHPVIQLCGDPRTAGVKGSECDHRIHLVAGIFFSLRLVCGELGVERVESSGPQLFDKIDAADGDLRQCLWRAVSRRDQNRRCCQQRCQQLTRALA